MKALLIALTLLVTSSLWAWPQVSDYEGAKYTIHTDGSYFYITKYDIWNNGCVKGELISGKWVFVCGSYYIEEI